MPTTRKKWNMKKVLTLITIVSAIITTLSTSIAVIKSLQVSKLQDSYQIQCTQIKEYKDKNGILVQEKTNITLSLANLKKSTDTTIKMLVAELTKKEIEIFMAKKADTIVKCVDSGGVKVRGDDSTMPKSIEMIRPDSIKVDSCGF